MSAEREMIERLVEDARTIIEESAHRLAPEKREGALKAVDRFARRMLASLDEGDVERAHGSAREIAREVAAFTVEQGRALEAVKLEARVFAAQRKGGAKRSQEDREKSDAELLEFERLRQENPERTLTSIYEAMANAAGASGEDPAGAVRRRIERSRKRKRQGGRS